MCCSIFARRYPRRLRGPSYGSKKPYARGSGTQEGPKNLVLRGIQKVNIPLGVSVSYLHELVRRERSEGFETLHVIEYGFASLVIGRIKIEKLFESVPTCKYRCCKSSYATPKSRPHERRFCGVRSMLIPSRSDLGIQDEGSRMSMK